MAKSQRTQNSSVVKGSEPKPSQKESEKRADSATESQNQSAERSKCRYAEPFAYPVSCDDSPENAVSSDHAAGKSRCGNGGRKAISLKNELRDLGRSLLALRRLLDIAQQNPGTAEAMAIDAEIAALVGYLHHRVDLVAQMVSGDVDPCNVWTVWNDAADHWLEPDQSDVVFEEWTVTQKVIHARYLLDRAERQVAQTSAETEGVEKKSDDQSDDLDGA